ncbi:M48 family metallopeptidase [candidate division KSB1 bacterium]|nr:M48 family metallopeptidase [candidate division KSB1 bacterium]
MNFRSSNNKNFSETLPEIGTVHYARHHRARQLRIAVHAENGVRVTIPRFVSFKRAREIVHSKAEWIKQQVRKLAHLKAEHHLRNAESPPLDHRVAKQALITRLEELARQYGFTYGRVFIRQQRTRWGSCSQQNNINLNIRLMQLPVHLRDYVIIHELVHTRVKNHSKEFWSTLDKFVGNSKALDKELKQYRISFLQ